jgi:hypothetical protein
MSASESTYSGGYGKFNKYNKFNNFKKYLKPILKLQSPREGTLYILKISHYNPLPPPHISCSKSCKKLVEKSFFYV